MTNKTQEQGRVKSYPIHQTVLGDAMLPGDDAFTIELRSHFSEMLKEHLEAGRQRSAIAFGQSLSEFTPTSVKDAGDVWKVRLLERWEKDQRPAIFKALEDFFANGGVEARIKTQSDFVSALVDAGVQVEGMAVLMDELAFSGNWHLAFVNLIQAGRGVGIRLTASSGCDRDLLAKAANRAGFNCDQFSRISANI
jgi:hypothetical protein